MTTDLDAFICGLGREHVEGFKPVEGALFLAGLKKLGAPIVDATVSLPEEPGSEFAASDEEVAQTMLLLASHEFYAHQCYLTYAAVMRGVSREALAELFDEIGTSELDDAKYALRKATVLLGTSAVQLPPCAATPPAETPEEMLEHMLQVEARAISLLKTLRMQVGESPTKYTIEEMLSGEQKHHDIISQHLGEARAAKPAPTPQQKVAGLLRSIKEKRANAPTAEQLVIAEQAAAGQEAAAEADFLRNQLGATQQQLQQTAEAANLAQQQVEVQNQQLQATQQQADLASQQAAGAMDQATMASADAAAQAEGKMRLAVRIQQFRQQLADIASQDPVTEEGQMPEPGMPTMETPGQGQDPAAAGQDPNAAAAPESKQTKEQEAEAGRAQADAAKQTAQAGASKAKDEAKAGGQPAVSVKVSAAKTAVSDAWIAKRLAATSEAGRGALAKARAAHDFESTLSQTRQFGKTFAEEHNARRGPVEKLFGLNKRNPEQHAAKLRREVAQDMVPIARANGARAKTAGLPTLANPAHMVQGILAKHGDNFINQAKVRATEAAKATGGSFQAQRGAIREAVAPVRAHVDDVNAHFAQSRASHPSQYTGRTSNPAIGTNPNIRAAANPTPTARPAAAAAQPTLGSPANARPSLAPAPAPVVRKAKATQGIDPMALSRHMATNAPAAAVQAGLQHRMPVVANANTLAHLESMSFDKLQALKLAVSKEWIAKRVKQPATAERRARFVHNVSRTTRDSRATAYLHKSDEEGAFKRVLKGFEAKDSGAVRRAEAAQEAAAGKERAARQRVGKGEVALGWKTASLAKRVAKDVAEGMNIKGVMDTAARNAVNESDAAKSIIATSASAKKILDSAHKHGKHLAIGGGALAAGGLIHAGVKDSQNERRLRALEAHAAHH